MHDLASMGDQLKVYFSGYKEYLNLLLEALKSTSSTATPSTPTTTTTSSSSPTPATPTTTTPSKEAENDKKEESNDDEGPDAPIVELENFQLWNDFHQFGTEMVITKTGRYVSILILMIYPKSFFFRFFCKVNVVLVLVSECVLS